MLVFAGTSKQGGLVISRHPLNLLLFSFATVPIIHRLCTSVAQDDLRRDRGRRECDAAFIRHGAII
jgi:hypothetical protein